MTIGFEIKKGSAMISKENKAAVKISFDEALKIELYYDFSERPLLLSAPANIGDHCELVLGEVRDTLYVNGILLDEEWCCGHIAADGELSGEIMLERFADEKHYEQPLKHRVGIEQLRGYGVNVGDCMPFTDDDGSFHIFWLYDRHHHKSKWGLGAHQWAHTSTSDLEHWDEHPMTAAVTDQLEGSICTGSVIHSPDGYRAWYAVRMSDGSAARITCAFSQDNIDYTKTNEYFVLPERYDRPSARDPKAIFFDGKYHLLVTTTERSSHNGCLAHLASEHSDMSELEDREPIIRWSDGSQPECPDWFEMGEYYYLVWSIGGRARYAYSRDPFGRDGWTIPEDNILDCGSVPKSALISTDCKYRGERIFVGFVPENGYAGHFIMKRTLQKSDGRLELVEL